MRVLIAEDNIATRRILEAMLTKCGYDVVSTCDGLEAWQRLQSEDPARLVVLDLIMPDMGGLEVCQRIRGSSRLQSTYVILLTVKGRKEDILAGFDAGADDYITKPFDQEELRARIEVGARIAELQEKLARRVEELEDALSEIRRLQGLLPICCYCKKIRDDRNYWKQVEEYITERSEARFTHSICPDCYERFAKPELARLRGERKYQNGDAEASQPLPQQFSTTESSCKID